MGGTTSRGLPYPTGTDLVRDGDNAIQALAEAVDTFAFKRVLCSLRRVNSTTWEAINDSGHTPIGVTSVSMTTTGVTVNYSGLGVKTIHSVHATPDEAFTASGVRVGASAGLTYTVIQFFMGASETPVNPGSLSRAGANVWFAGWFS